MTETTRARKRGFLEQWAIRILLRQGWQPRFGPSGDAQAELDRARCAIEFGEYMAKAAVSFMLAVDNEQVDITDEWRTLNSAIYEFRKHAAKFQERLMDKTTDTDEIPNILDFSDPQSEYAHILARMEAAETVIFAYEDRDWARSPAQKARLTEEIAAARAAWGKSRETHVVRSETDA